MAGYQKSKLPIKAGRPRHCHQSNICTNTQREIQIKSTLNPQNIDFAERFVCRICTFWNQVVCRATLLLF